jgi:hypothetical protein
MSSSRSTLHQVVPEICMSDYSVLVVNETRGLGIVVTDYNTHKHTRTHNRPAIPTLRPSIEKINLLQHSCVSYPILLQAESSSEGVTIAQP